VIDWTLFNEVDWVIIVVLSMSMILSLWRGFTREAISLAGWVAAFVIANVFAAQLAGLLSAWISNITGSYVAAYALLIVGTLIVAGLVSKLVARVVRVSGLSLLDRLLGTIFGFARGIILVLVAAYIVRQLAPPQNVVWLEQAQLMPHIDMLAQWVQLMFEKASQPVSAGLKP